MGMEHEIENVCDILILLLQVGLHEKPWLRTVSSLADPGLIPT